MTDGSRLPTPEDEPAWVHSAGPFQAMGHRFAIRTTDAGVGRYLERLWASCRTTDEPSVVYGLEIVRAHADAAPLYRLRVDETPLSQTSRASIALRNLVRRINHDVIAEAEDLVVIHASGATRDGVGALFPAPMEAGKTTLVAGLIRAGWGYLSDEAVAIDRDSLDLWPYPKPLSVDPGSWVVLPDLKPQLPDALEPYSTEQWQVAPEDIRPDAAVGPVQPRVIIAPSYSPGAAASLEPVSRASMVLLLGKSCFSMQAHSRDVLPVLNRLARRCACYRLTMGEDLERACRLVVRAMRSIVT